MLSEMHILPLYFVEVAQRHIKEVLLDIKKFKMHVHIFFMCCFRLYIEAAKIYQQNM